MSSALSTPHPSTNDFIVEAADWVELTCLFRSDSNVSREDLKRELIRASRITDQRAEQRAADAFLELEDRVKVCGLRKNAVNSYPFVLNSTKTLLEIKYPFRPTSNVACLYWFLLLISRMSMDSTSRVLKSIDPTKVFERLCADVLASFWAVGGSHSGAFIFGTAANKGGKSKAAKRKAAMHAFEKNIQQLCDHVGEGVGFKQGAALPGAGDGKLDVVSWRKFNDGRPGSLIGFAQCKTGVNWDEHLDELQPAKFSREFMRRQLIVEPVKLYMVPSRIESTQWDVHTDHAGILLDRCRITQYGGTIRPEILKQCRDWARAAIQRQRKQIPKK
jgi:hypothetical protein